MTRNQSEKTLAKAVQTEDPYPTHYNKKAKAKRRRDPTAHFEPPPTGKHEQV